jgi:hypothetical protein
MAQRNIFSVNVVVLRLCLCAIACDGAVDAKSSSETARSAGDHVLAKADSEQEFMTLEKELQLLPRGKKLRELAEPVLKECDPTTVSDKPELSWYAGSCKRSCHDWNDYDCAGWDIMHGRGTQGPIPELLKQAAAYYRKSALVKKKDDSRHAHYAYNSAVEALYQDAQHKPSSQEKLKYCAAMGTLLLECMEHHDYSQSYGCLSSDSWITHQGTCQDHARFLLNRRGIDYDDLTSEQEELLSEAFLEKATALGDC